MAFVVSGREHLLMLYFKAVKESHPPDSRSPAHHLNAAKRNFLNLYDREREVVMGLIFRVGVPERIVSGAFCLWPCRG